MQVPMSTMASNVLLGLGRFHLAALAQSDATKGLATAFQPTQDALAAAKTGREQAEDALIAPRVGARFAEFGLERVLRQIALQAHAADNNTDHGAAFKALFPNGLDAELRPRGAAQLTASTALRGRLDTQPAAAGVKAQCMKDFDAALATLGGALEARRMAERALGIARATEDGARETFISAYDSNAGAIRQMFPRNRAQQDLHFDEFRVQRSASDDDNGGDQPSGSSAGPGAKAA